jgi:hypothetical protein
VHAARHNEKPYERGEEQQGIARAHIQKVRRSIPQERRKPVRLVIIRRHYERAQKHGQNKP